MSDKNKVVVSAALDKSVASEFDTICHEHAINKSALVQKWVSRWIQMKKQMPSAQEVVC